MRMRRRLARQVIAATVTAAAVVVVLSAALLGYWVTDGFRDYVAWCDRFHGPLAVWAKQHGHYPDDLSVLDTPSYQPRYQPADCRYQRVEDGYEMVVVHGFGVSFYQSSKREWVHD
ncbi:MAG: hypothetical protein ACPG43_02715 [Alcanivoracaceae bacterium]